MFAPSIRELTEALKSQETSTDIKDDPEDKRLACRVRFDKAEGRHEVFRKDGTDEVRYTLLQPREIKVIPHEGKLYRATIEQFERALARVAFSVIDRKTETVTVNGVVGLSRAVANAVHAVLTDDRLMGVVQDPKAVDTFRFNGDDIGKIKAVCKQSLGEAYMIGTSHAVSEMSQALQKPLEFTSTRQLAAEYIEGNGARMAGNIADGARAIIQQDLINAIKFGWSPAQTRDSILRRLARKGFAFTADLLVSTPGEEPDFEPAIDLPKYIASLARTNIFESMNEARYAVFTDPRQQGFVRALEYSAILDDRTTTICRSLDGFIREADDEIWNEYRPPNHWNCRSLLIPVTLADAWDGERSPDPTVEPQDGFGGKPI